MSRAQSVQRSMARCVQPDRVFLWDAGTEVHEEPGLGANQAPRQKAPNTGPDERGVVQRIEEAHDGFRIGDRLRIGSAEFIVTQPRMPCYKLGVRFGRDDMVKRFLHSGRTGFYLAVSSEGAVAAGDAIALHAHADDDVTVSDIVGLYTHDAHDDIALNRVIAVPALPENWRQYFRKRLSRPKHA